jgi:hypothetical protein
VNRSSEDQRAAFIAAPGREGPRGRVRATRTAQRAPVGLRGRPAGRRWLRSLETLARDLENSDVISAPTKRRPSSSAATPVVPLPTKGSRTMPPGGQIRTNCCMTGVGFPVTWCLSAIRTGSRITPHRQPTSSSSLLGPAVAHTTYSHCAANRPMAGRHACVLSQTTMPRQTHPPAWIASVVVGSCRQSVKTHSGAPGLATRRHSPIQRAHQYSNDRWSRLSPENAGRSICVPVIVYFSAGGTERSPRVNPPDEYGGSVMTASTLASGMVRSTASASPGWSSQQAFSTLAGSRQHLRSRFASAWSVLSFTAPLHSPARAKPGTWRLLLSSLTPRNSRRIRSSGVTQPFCQGGRRGFESLLPLEELGVRSRP